MNSLFRNIKENNNLDTLEESDDEDDFENTNPSKYIIPNKNLLLNVYILKNTINGFLLMLLMRPFLINLNYF